MSNVLESAFEPLRLSDLVPLRRMLGSDSVTIRVHPDGTLAPFQPMPGLFFERPIRDALAPAMAERFEAACRRAIAEFRPISLLTSSTSHDEILIHPILDDEGTTCRFLICWVRHSARAASTSDGVAWSSLDLADVVTRYRTNTVHGVAVIDAAPWWARTGGEPLELWPHHTHVSAMGLGHAVMETLIIDAAEVAATHGGGPAVRIVVPSADMLAGLVPVVHGALRATGVPADRLLVSIDVDLAVDPDLLPIIVHLRTMGLQIDIVGLDALTSTLHRVSDTSDLSIPVAPPEMTLAGPWVGSFAAACNQAA